ncbi:MAG: anthranilate synthase component I family protein [Patescibacteria group bacterium]
MSNHLANLKLADVMLRLGPDENHVCALASTSSKGWQTKLAWNPVDIYRPKGDYVAGLEAFAKQQQAKERLVIGYLSYDFGATLHCVALNTDDDLSMPLVFAASFDNWLEFNSTGALVAAKDVSFASEVDHILNRPARPLPAKAYEQAFRPVQSRAKYDQAFAKVQKYITAGDVYQINLAHRLEAATTSSGRDLFCALSETSRSDFQAFVEDGEFEILSLSPERFIQVKGNVIKTMPIKGTRPRGNTKEEDKELEEDLLTNDKERAELDMITDLMRNDLGEICSTGSVKVVNRRVLRAYPTLWHAHSEIQGSLRADISPMGALTHVSPGGSITGCPKKRAIEIIDELEVKRRGLYTGSIFTVQPDGSLDSNIAIRTVIKKGNQLYLSVGGGIVHDSKQASEYQESLDKAASFMVGKDSLGNDI